MEDVKLLNLLLKKIMFFKKSTCWKFNNWNTALEMRSKSSGIYLLLSLWTAFQFCYFPRFSCFFSLLSCSIFSQSLSYTPMLTRESLKTHFFSVFHVASFFFYQWVAYLLGISFVLAGLGLRRALHSEHRAQLLTVLSSYDSNRCWNAMHFKKSSWKNRSNYSWSF